MRNREMRGRSSQLDTNGTTRPRKFNILIPFFLERGDRETDADRCEAGDTGTLVVVKTSNPFRFSFYSGGGERDYGKQLFHHFVQIAFTSAMLKKTDDYAAL